MMTCGQDNGLNDKDECSNSRKKIFLQLSNKNNQSNWRNYEQRKLEEQVGDYADGLARILKITKKEIYLQ